MTYLLSWQGSVLSRHRVTDALMLCRIGEESEHADPVDIGIPAHQLQVSFDHYLRNNPAMPPHTIPHGPMQGWEVQRAGDGRCVSISRDGNFLCSPQGSESVAFRSEARAWEWFLPIANHDYDALRCILRRDWIVRSTGELVRSTDVSVGEHWSLRVGSLWLDLRFQLPLDLSCWPHRLTVLRDGWRIEQICLFRPLVYFAAFGNPVIMGQFALSMRSLRTIGGYSGPVTVMSDQSAEDIAALIGEPTRTASPERSGGSKNGEGGDPGMAFAPAYPIERPARAWASTLPGQSTEPDHQMRARTNAAGSSGSTAAPAPSETAAATTPSCGDATLAKDPWAEAQCAVLWRACGDRTAFMSARYTIVDWAEAWAFQPILYVDTDIVFEAPVEPLLRAIATSDRLAAPFEPAAPLGITASVGAGLLQLDGIDPRDRLGFNSGTIGIPNLAEQAGTVRLICRVMANHAAQRGRVALTHGDQEVANYVAVRTGAVDTTLIAGFVRVGGDIDLSHAGRRIVAHFWASPTAEGRLEAMRRHMRRLGLDV